MSTMTKQSATRTPMTIIEWSSLLASARDRITSIEAEMANLRDLIAVRSIEIFQGDSAAKEASDAARKQLADLELELTVSKQTVDHAERKVAELTEQENEREKARRRAEAEKLAAQLVIKSEEFDVLAGALRQALAERRALSIEIQSLIGAHGLLKRFYHKGCINGALTHSGLSDYVDIPRGLASERMPLADYDRTVVSGLGLSIAIPAGGKQ